MPRLFTSLLLAVNILGHLCACADDRQDITASIILWNGSTQCSGSIISKGPKYGAGVGAAHCFVGRLGGEFRVGYADGSTSPATLVAHDTDLDLSLFTVPASAILGVAQIPERMPTPKLGYGAIGMPAGVGPTHRDLTRRATTGTASQNNAPRWMFDVDGTIAEGFSGGGVFADQSRLCAVVSERSTNDGGRVLYATTHNQLSEFVKRNAAKLKDCGEFFCYQDAPPPPAPQREGTPQPNAPRWQPQPNVKLPEIPKNERQNSTTFKDEAATDHIRKLEVRVAELERRLLALEQSGSAPVPPLQPILPTVRPPTDAELLPLIRSAVAGLNLKDGTNGKPGVVTVVLKWADGKPIAEVPDVPSGKKVTFPIAKIISEAK